MSDEEIKTLDDVDGDIEQLEKIVVNEDSEILVGMTIDGKEVFVEIGVDCPAVGRFCVGKYCERLVELE